MSTIEGSVKVGVIGLGMMGRPIAQNVARAGFPVGVFARSAREAGLVENASVCRTPDELLGWSDVVLLTLPGDSEIDECLGRSGRRAGYPLGGKTIVNMATVAPAYSRELGDYVAGRGGHYVEAAISGSKRPAELGQLVILVATDDKPALVRLRPVLAAIAKRTLDCGEPPNAMRFKLANNLLLITFLEGVAELVLFAEGLGLDVEAVLDLLLSGPLANQVLTAKADKLAEGDFSPEAPLKHVAKDLRLIVEAARDAEIQVPVASTNLQLFERALASGLGDQDAVAILETLRGL